VGNRDAVNIRTDRNAVAARIAAEVQYAHALGESRLVKVTSLLNAFRSPDGPVRIRDVLSALHESGIAVDSGWQSDGGLPVIRRTGVLTLTVAPGAAPCSRSDVEDDTIRVSVWRPGSGPTAERALGDDLQRGAEDVLWFDIDPPALPVGEQPPDVRRRRLRPFSEPSSRDATEGAVLAKAADPNYELVESRVQYVTGRLEKWCPGLNEEMVRDLLRQDVQPKVETYGDEDDGLRGVSAVAVIARERPKAADDPSDDVADELVFQTVEIIVGQGWLVTCWHPSRIVTGSGQEAGHPVLREPFLSYVHYRLRQDESDRTSSGDLGLYLTRALVGTYDASHRMMERWVASWEVAFFHSLGHHEKAARLKDAAGRISNLLSMTGELRRRLTAFEHARWSTADKSWFPGVGDNSTGGETGPGVTALATFIDTSERTFTLLADTIRADVNLLMLQSTAAQQEAGEQMQGYLGKVTGLVLVPTLVAGVFGANTAVPGGQAWWGFEVMLLLMVVSAVLVYAAIRRREK